MAFNDPNKALIARIIKTANSGKRIEINGAGFANGVAFYTGDAQETTPGFVQPDSDANLLSISMHSPLAAGQQGTSVFLATAKPGSGFQDLFSLTTQSLIAKGTHDVSITGPDTPGLGQNTYWTMQNDGLGDMTEINSPRIFLKDERTGNGLIAQGNGIDVIGNRWFTKADTALNGTWVDVAGARFGYYKDAVGNVHVRGLVQSGGATAAIVTLPVGFRPSSNLNFTMAINGGVTICSVGVSTAGVLTVATNLASASASGIYLDVINYPTA